MTKYICIFVFNKCMAFYVIIYFNRELENAKYLRKAVVIAS